MRTGRDYESKKFSEIIDSIGDVTIFLKWKTYRKTSLVRIQLFVS